jgi:Flp pilus assembly protein TadD
MIPITMQRRHKMDKNTIMGKMTCVALCVFFCLSQVSCSLWKQGEMERESDRSEAKIFVSKIRTPRGNPDSHYLLACYYQERGRHKEAIGEFNKVIVIDPLHVKAYNGLGVSYSELKEHQKAVDAFLTALKIDPKLDYVHNNLGYSFLLQGYMDAAIAVFRKAAVMNNGSSRIHNNLGMAYLMTGDAEKAREEFAKGGGDAWAVYNMAQLYYQNDMFYEAREHFAKALDMKPSLTGARRGLEASDTLYRISHALSEKAEIAGDSMIAEGTAKIEGSLPERADAAKRVDSMKWRQRVEIEIANGSGVRHMARNVGSHLKKRGFKVVRFTNANHFNYRKGSITYSKKYLDAAKAVAREIPHIKDLRMADKHQRGDVKIKVLVGKDLIPYRKLYKNDRS